MDQCLDFACDFSLETLEVNFVDADEVPLSCSTSVLVNSSQSPSECRTPQ